MKTIEVNLYSYKDLSDEAKQQVIKDIAQRESEDENFTLSECMDSLKSIVNSVGAKLSNWSVGPYSPSYACVDHQNGLEGGRKTIALFFRALIKHGYERPKHFKDMQFPGICGFTGVCFDDDIAQDIWNELLSGSSFSSAVNVAADTIRKICEDDLSYRTSEEGILETLDQNEEIYLEDGSVA